MNRGLNMKDNKGAITVFMVLIMLAMFMMAGLLIDMSRIILAQYTLDCATESAARTVMAGYDETLMSDYGLYALQKSADDEDANKTKMEKYIKGNLTIKNAGENAPYFSILKLKDSELKNVNITYSKPIWESSTFREQVIEYEQGRKYALILQEAVDILGDWVSGSITAEINKANSANEANKTAKSSARSYDGTKSDLKDKIKGNPKLSKIQIDNINKGIDIGFDIGKTTAKSFVSNALSTASEEFNDYLSNKSFCDFEETLSEAKTKMADLSASVNTAKEELNGTSGYDNQSTQDPSINVNDYVSNAGSTDYNAVSQRVAAAEKSLSAAEEFLNDSKTKFENYSNDYKTIGKIYSLVYMTKQVEEYWNENEVECDDATRQSIIDEANGKINELRNQIITSEFKNRIGSNIINLNNFGTDGLITSIQGVCDSVVTKQNQLINSIESLEISSVGEIVIPEAKEDYPGKSEQEANEENLNAQIKDFQSELERNQSNNMGTLFSGDYAGYRFSNPVGIWNGISNFCAALPVAQIIPMVEDIAGSITSGDLEYNVALTAYTMEKTNNVTSSARRKHYFKWGETEYVKYGWDAQWQNVTNAISSIISFRFTVNFVYYFIKTPGELVARLIGAASLGGVQTAVDATELFITGSGCKLVPVTGAAPKFTYSDHLMVMMFLENSKETKLLDTIQATLIQRDKTGNANLKEMYTEINAKAELDVELIFLKLFSFSKINFGGFNNGKYTVKSNVTMSY